MAGASFCVFREPPAALDSPPGVSGPYLKPDNVMLVPDPERPGEQRVKVLDFGIAKLSQNASGPDGKVRTETGTMIGTPAYMAPEQCLADPQLDGKADVYALGVMLYEMLSDRLPFSAEHSFDYMVAHVRGTPRPLSEVAPQVPPEVVDLVHAMLAKIPAERPPMETIVALLEQLQAALPAIWALPSLAGAPSAERAALASGDTELGRPGTSALRSKESLALGATVAGRATPSGLLSSRALPPASQGSWPGPSSPSGPSGPSGRSGRSARESASLTPAPEVSAVVGPAAQRSRSRWLLAALLLAATLAAGGLSRRRAASPVATTPAPVAPLRLVRWVVLSVPPGAEVVRADGQLLGTTPWELDRPPGAGETVLTLRHPGFKDKALLLSHSTDVKTEVYLEAAPTAPPGPEVDARAATPVSPLAKRRRPPARSSGPSAASDAVKLLLD